MPTTMNHLRLASMIAVMTLFGGGAGLAQLKAPRIEDLSARLKACEQAVGFPGLAEALAAAPIEIVESDDKKALLRSRATGKTVTIQAQEWCGLPFFTPHAVVIEGTETTDGVRFAYPKPAFALPSWFEVPDFWETHYLLVSKDSSRGVVEVKLPDGYDERQYRDQLRTVIVNLWGEAQTEGDWIVSSDGKHRLRFDFKGIQRRIPRGEVTFVER